METASMRQKLHQYIELGDDKLLKIMYDVAKGYNEEYDDSDEYPLTAADSKVFEERRNKRLSGESKTYNWEEAKKIITGKILPDGF